MRSNKNPFASPLLITASATQTKRLMPGQARSLFAQPHHPLYVDLGTGGGQFLTKASQLDPHVNWIGIENELYHLRQALKKRKIDHHSNIRYIWMQVEQLRQVFAQGEVDRFYLHFCTPWPDPRHAKKRLTDRRFLNVYHDLLSPTGDLLFKTDVPALYTFSYTELQALGWEIMEESRDLHQSRWSQANIITEWEEITTANGCPIHYLKAKPPRQG
jgi:tRNA (guanine-N7-)-methyltransferase